nr:hypothetical protein GCM10017745_35300 [Saccharothrix mutabilis subsp. capreolus]
MYRKFGLSHSLNHEAPIDRNFAVRDSIPIQSAAAVGAKYSGSFILIVFSRRSNRADEIVQRIEVSVYIGSVTSIEPTHDQQRIRRSAELVKGCPIAYSVTDTVNPPRETLLNPRATDTETLQRQTKVLCSKFDLLGPS